MDTRRQDILDAALDVFLERGFDGATLAQIRARSGASTGSIYHFFRGKADIAAALLTAATSGWASQAINDSAPDDARAMIRGSVSGFLRWGRENPRLFAFMDDLLARSSASAEFQQVAELLADGRRQASELYAGWAKAGLVRPISWDLAYALIMGPAYAVLRNRPQRPLGDTDIAIIVDAAWAAVAAA
jgi:AcrR family transcriptional regulator